ncbi:MAG: hypothetical protein IJ055_05480, partial [Oscillospiraceae bacterium]|nr:hypothetical protein [Oscillospiraceae bacterium]
AAEPEPVAEPEPAAEPEPVAEPEAPGILPAQPDERVEAQIAFEPVGVVLDEAPSREPEAHAAYEAPSGEPEERYEDIYGEAHTEGSYEAPSEGPEESYEDIYGEPSDESDAQRYAQLFGDEPLEDTEESELRHFMRDALDESAEELSELRAEPAPEDEGPSERRHFWTRNTYFLAGLLCVFLATVGLITCVRFVWSRTSSFVGSSSLRRELEEAVYPVAVTDLPAFDAPTDLGSESILAASMMELLMYADLDSYRSDYDVLVIPAQDVLNMSQHVFTAVPDVQLATFYVAGETFYYDETSGCFNVSASPAIFSYAPKVESIRRTDDIYVITVRYCSDTPSWQTYSGNFGNGNEKVMRITLEKSGSDYRIAKLSPESED